MKEINSAGLFECVGCIDEELLAEACSATDAVSLQKTRENTIKKHRKFHRVRFIATIAACFVLLAAIIPISLYLKNKGNVIQEGHANPISVGETYVFKNSESRYFGTKIFYKSCKNYKITIFLEKADNKEIFWHLEGDYIKDVWEDENGKPDYDLIQYYATTDESYVGQGLLVEDGIVFTVNGEVGVDFPKVAGEYEIIIDYSKLAELCNDLDLYLISSYNAFYIGEEKVYQE